MGQAEIAGGPLADCAVACTIRMGSCRRLKIGLRQWNGEEATGGTDQEEECELFGQGQANHLSRGVDQYLTLDLGRNWKVQALQHQ